MDFAAQWPSYRGLQYHDLPAPVRQVAGHSVLDWFGCALAGHTQPLVRILLDELASTPGPCNLVGTGHTTSAAYAALINGAAGHALDFDDTSVILNGHPTAPVLPAVLAQAQQQGADGKHLLTAFVVGVEVAARLGYAMGLGHYRLGWHVTSTMGVFGAAAATAHLLDLDAGQYAHAMGIAASQSSGLKANFGTMTKPLHAGQAAERGLLAARLAARGFTANANAFAGEQGLMQAAGADALENNNPRSLPDDQWAIRSTLFKYHSACHLTHAAIECTLHLHEQVLGQISGQMEGEFVSAVVVVNPALKDICAIAEPRTGLQGKFSLAATVSMAWLGLDTADPAIFADEVVQRADLQALLRRVKIDYDGSLPITAANVTLEMSNHKTWQYAFDAGIPAQDLDEQGRRLADKFVRIAGPEVGDDAAHDLCASILQLSKLVDLQGLMQQTVVAGPVA